MSEKICSHRSSYGFKNGYISKVYSKYGIGMIMQYIVLLVGFIGYLDIRNYPSSILETHGSAPSILVVSSLSLLILIYLHRIHIFEWSKIIAINIYDCVLQIIWFSIIFYICLAIVLNMLNSYKIYILISITLFNVISMWRRRCNYIKAQITSDLYESNIVDLKDLYENKVKVSGNMILLEERDVDYDLLYRSSIISHLVNTILSTKPKGKFVISIEGKWGSGKTTIMKNAKKIIEESDPSILIIDDFDPWMYGSEESIVDNFFSCLIKRNYLKINTAELKRNIKILSSAITKSPQDSNFLHSLFVQNTDVNSSKKLINEYLKHCGKRIVIYIDNLDRVDDDKVIFIFKLIGNVLDFERITYVISFDNEKVKKIFDLNLNIDYDYIKKIIQMQINVPEINIEVMEKIVKISTSNLINLYKKSGEKVEYEEFISFVTKHLHDIRDFKRFVNSIVVKVLKDESSLYQRDKMILEFIKMNQYDLYKYVYLNKEFFISEDLMNNQELWIKAYSREKFNNEGKIFFQDLFTKFPEASDLLGIIFPYVKRYNNNQDLRPEHFYGDSTKHQNIARNRGIASAKYFDLYFSETENQYSILGGLIDKLIQSINKERGNIPTNFDELLKNIPSYDYFTLWIPLKSLWSPPVLLKESA